jgi:thioredoxin 1
MNQKFEEYIQGNIPVVVDFFDDFTDSCDKVDLLLKDIKSIVGASATILKMNIENNKFYRDKYKVYAVPTIIIFKRGKLLLRNSGGASKTEIIRCIAQNVN